MTNLVFFLWMLLFPLTEEIGDWITIKYKKPVELDGDGGTIYVIIFGIIYLGVGYLLYEKH